MRLFEPLKIRGLELPNRVVLAAMGTSYGYLNKAGQGFYLERARGGVGTVMTGDMAVDAFLVDDMVAKFRARFTTPIHDLGVKVGAQFGYGNKYPYWGGTNPEWVACTDKTPTNLPGMFYMYPASEFQGCRPLTVPEIKDIVDRYGRGCAKAREAGFDFVEVHACHGHSLGYQFFSPLDNQRTDEYGGSLENRMRFGLEIVRSIRAAVGDDYPIFFRISAVSDWPGDVTLEDSIAFAKELAKAGVDVLNVSANGVVPYDVSKTGIMPSCPPKRAPMGTFTPYAAAIKQHVSIPVATVGRINSPKVAERILQQDQADLIELGRQLICDPAWTRKVAEGREKEIVACESCTECTFATLHGRPMTCHKNPRLGFE